jgi:hypothetical protein
MAIGTRCLPVPTTITSYSVGRSSSMAPPPSASLRSAKTYAAGRDPTARTREATISLGEYTGTAAAAALTATLAATLSEVRRWRPRSATVGRSMDGGRAGQGVAGGGWERERRSGARPRVKTDSAAALGPGLRRRSRPDSQVLANSMPTFPRARTRPPPPRPPPANWILQEEIRRSLGDRLPPDAGAAPSLLPSFPPLPLAPSIILARAISMSSPRSARQALLNSYIPLI